MYVTLADGVPKQWRTSVTLYGRVIMTSFLVFADARTSRTLLGVGFIEDAMLALNLPQRTCSFVYEPRKEYDLNPNPESIEELSRGGYRGFRNS